MECPIFINFSRRFRKFRPRKGVTIAIIASMCRIVVAPDKFKSSLPSSEVAAAIGEGLRLERPSLLIALIPLADGGEGTVEAMVCAAGGRSITTSVTGPLPGTTVDAQWGWLNNGTAVIEMSAASGLALLRPEDRDPERTTSFGTGELIRAAHAAGAARIVVGIGGSATTDGGVGCAQACGWRFRMSDGSWRGPADRPIVGGEVGSILGVEPGGSMAPIHVACDVDNPLLGPRGAARVFGPQKGATAEQVERLDRSLQHLAGLLGKEDVAQSPGAGAAGGLGFGLMAFHGAAVESGFDLVARTLGLRERLAGADLVITGEGRLDASSLHGKTVIGVARLCRGLTIPCMAIVGSVGPGAAGAAAEGLHQWHAIRDLATSDEDSMRRARELIVEAARRSARDLESGKIAPSKN